MNDHRPHISKTNYMEGLQCPKLLWYEFHKKSLIKHVGPVTQFVFDEGKRVGKMAQKLFPDGILIERMLSPEGQSRQSFEALKRRKPLFEAGFTYDQAYALADILAPVNEDKWDIYEVKSGTSLDEHHFQDIAFQKYVYEGAGLKIRKCFLVHVNKEFVKHGEIDPKDLFVVVDATEQAHLLSRTVPEDMRMMLEIISQETEPEVKIGPHCKNPHECPIKDICWAFLPKDNIFDLYSGGKLSFQMFEDGILKLSDIPKLYKLSEKQLIQVKATKEGKVQIDKEEVKEFLTKIEYPLFFLDFETLGSAVPVYDNTSPYEAVPFQYSLYVIEKEGAKPVPYAYLAPGDVDPRPEILKQLKGILGNKGPILAYWATFEKTCIRKAAKAYPEYSEWADKVQERFIDLLEPFKNFDYYDPKQEGSASLKYVLPALTEMNYENLLIGEGGAASSEYYRVTFDRSVDPKEREKVRTALLKYCNIDTEGMIEILKVLKKSVKAS